MNCPNDNNNKNDDDDEEKEKDEDEDDEQRSNDEGEDGERHTTGTRHTATKSVASRSRLSKIGDGIRSRTRSVRAQLRGLSLGANNNDQTRSTPSNDDESNVDNDHEEDDDGDDDGANSDDEYVDGNLTFKEPTNVDVLCGRGGKSNHHPGNVSYRKKVATIKKEYKLCTNKGEKKIIVEAIMNDIESCGGNFLQKDTKKQTQDNKKGNGGDNVSSWYVVDHSLVLKKVHQALRDNNDPENIRQKRERYHAKQDKEKNK